MTYELLSRKNELILKAITKACEKSGWRAFKRDFRNNLPKSVQNDLDSRIGIIASAGYLDAPYSSSGYEQIGVTDAGLQYKEIKQRIILASFLKQVPAIVAIIISLASLIVAIISLIKSSN